MRCSKLGLASTLVALATMMTPASRGDELTWMTRDGRMKCDPVFVDDGAAIVYAVQLSPVLMGLVRLEPDSGASRPLHGELGTSQRHASFSPDGRRYAFVETAGVTRVRLIVRDTGTGEQAQFDPPGGRNHLAWPSMSPDGRTVVFSFPTSGGEQIVAFSFRPGAFTEADLLPLTTTAGVNDWPAYSPDGEHIAFGSSRDGDFELYVMRSDGSDVRRITNSAGRDMRPAWSPDGRRIAFTSARDGNYEIYVIGADGTGLARVTEHPEQDDFAVWHPDGRRLLIVAERDGRHDLALIDVPPLVEE